MRRPASASRRVVASFDTYPEAQRAVDYLSDNGFPVERVTIVGSDLRYVEQVTGRRSYGKATLEGGLNGAIIGALIGFFFGLFSIGDPVLSAVVLAFWGLIFGAVLGALAGLAAHAMSGGRRDFSSASTFQASRYDVLVDHDEAADAEVRLQQMPQAGAAPPQQDPGTDRI
jgi:hypothetical protein